MNSALNTQRQIDKRDQEKKQMVRPDFFRQEMRIEIPEKKHGLEEHQA